MKSIIMGFHHTLLVAAGLSPRVRPNRNLMPLSEGEAIDLIRVLEGKAVSSERKQDLAKKLRRRL